MIDIETIRRNNAVRRLLPDQENARPFQGWQPPWIVVAAADDVDALLAEVVTLEVLVADLAMRLRQHAPMEVTEVRSQGRIVWPSPNGDEPIEDLDAIRALIAEFDGYSNAPGDCYPVNDLRDAASTLLAEVDRLWTVIGSTDEGSLLRAIAQATSATEAIALERELLRRRLEMDHEEMR